MVLMTVAICALIINIMVLSAFVHVLFLVRWLSYLLSMPKDSTVSIECLIGKIVLMHARNVRYILEQICGCQLALSMPHKALKENVIIVSNHVSWADTLILMAVFADRLPHLRFFQKKSLRWFPVIGTTCMGLGHPFVSRSVDVSSRKKGVMLLRRQKEEIYKQCEHIFQMPSALVVFVEGTRGNSILRANSPYQHLLAPQALGVSLAMAAAEPQGLTLLDVTLLYPQYKERNMLKEILSGKCKKVGVDVTVCEEFPKTKDVHDRNYRKATQAWLQDLWASKDAILSKEDDVFV